MGKQLLDIIFSSEKRKRVLLLLQDGPKETNTLLRSLDTKRKSLLPQIKVLEDNNLVFHYKDTYELTSIGKVVVDKMSPLVDNIELFESDIDYWGTHRLDFVPAVLLKEMRQVKNCTILQPSLTELFELNRRFMEETYNSSHLCTVTTLFHPQFRDIYLKLVDSGVKISLIISDELFRKTKAEKYSDLKQIMNQKSVDIFVYNKPIKLASFSVNNHSLILRLLATEGQYDNRYLILEGQGAVNWGKEVFDYYLKESMPITEIQQA
ncbi:winged helix-turn-helix domain-containing protein [Methanolobus zinderi]|uniref:Winged helix-turn-helix domain-containing protein n=1 Tax=Methanolobus zinderi TaxID=536044 RepID=A0A7D5I4R7_9EURY|nr:winged helix-turn-helix domain-containing protein [Methanolobus zinderi]KXS42928.1 MAG: hypothetical protein AWU59_1396 [Methanolobus sp. T82-4]QLC49924.1 winged helix-turn-helix domain-containing protein [Methanolobus zinderi]